MPIEQLHTIDIRYPPYEANRSLRCISVADFDSYDLRDFRDFLPEAIAQEEFRKVAVNTTQHILEVRQQDFGESRKLPDMQEISAFLGGISICPFGKLFYVDTLEPPVSLGISSQPISTPGVTSHLHRQSFVIDKNITPTEVLHFDMGPDVPALTRNEYVGLIAVHELVHLAGIPDTVYCIVNWGQREVSTNIMFAPSTLGRPGKRPKGLFLEEAFATLCSYMYLWKKHPELAVDQRTIPRRSPSGVEVNLPVRHAYSGNTYDYAAWSLQRVLDVAPQLWSTLLRSRTYGVSPEEIRGKVKSELDKLHPRLFEAMDVADVKNLEHVIQTARFTDQVVQRVMRG